MYDDVLIPTDGSDAVEAALTHGLPIAERDDATVHAIYVLDRRITTAADAETRPRIERTLEREADEALETVADAAADAGLEVVREHRAGTPHKEILSYAADADVDLIVIASHGKSPREKLTSLGSVSERVVDGADVPTLVVRDED